LIAWVDAALFVGFMRKILPIPMTMSLVWWSAISNSQHTGIWLKGDHLGKCWEEVLATVLCSRLINSFKFANRQHKQHRYQKLIKYNYLPTAVCFLVGVHDLTNLEWEYLPKWIRLQNMATNNHSILTYLTTFSLEKMDKICCYSSVFLHMTIVWELIWRYWFFGLRTLPKEKAAATFDFTSFFKMAFLGPHTFLYSWDFFGLDFNNSTVVFTQ